ncbi:MAG: RHS repeat-associated core domain-containing protein [Flavobacterium sp.]|uniref:RHS repeat-associated core domain-containing protein n=1 Tax=Flavobacterium sp. TaxID=239 RepID=UPI0035275A14
MPSGEQVEYKYKYNGKEWQDELGLNFYDYGARNYDPAIGRYFTVDAFSEKFEDRTPYHYVSNDPINLVDVEGHFELPVKDQNKYKVLTNYLKNNIKEILGNQSIMNSLMKYGSFTEQQIKDKIVKFGKGSIKLNIVGRDRLSMGNGYYSGGRDNEVYIYEELAQQLENATGYERELALLAFLTTVLHESVHYGNETYNYGRRNEWVFMDRYGFERNESEDGRAFEIDAFWDCNYSDYYDNAALKTGKEGMKAMNKMVNNKRALNNLGSLPQSTQDYIRQLLEQNPDIILTVKE